MASVKLYLDIRHPVRSGDCNVYVAISHKGSTRLVPTGARLQPKNWDALGCRVTGRQDKAYINGYLEQCKARVEAVALRARLDGTLWDMTAQDLKDLATDVPKRVRTLLLPYMEEKAALCSPGSRAIRIQGMSAIRRYAGDGLTLGDVTAKWVAGWLAWLEGNGLKRNTRANYLGALRATFNAAVKEGLAQGNPFDGLAVPHERGPARALSVEALRDIATRDLDGDIAMWRDMFMLSFYLCGINVADMRELREVNAQGRVEYDRAKTGKRYSIKVEPEAMAIINRYRDGTCLVGAACARWCAPAMAKVMNRHLERLRPGLTSYWARHTWASMASELDIPDDVISRALGHSGLTGARITEVYINFNNKKIDQANRKVIDWVLYGRGG